MNLHLEIKSGERVGQALLRGSIQYYCTTSSIHLNYALIRRMAFLGSGFIRRGYSIKHWLKKM